MTWSVQPLADEDDVVMHDAVWSVLTGDDDVPGALRLRIADHGQDVMAGEGTSIIMQPDQAEAILRQLVEDIIPYWKGLVSE